MPSHLSSMMVNEKRGSCRKPMLNSLILSNMW